MLTQLHRLSRRPTGGLLVAGGTIALLSLLLLAGGNDPARPALAKTAAAGLGSTKLLAVPERGAYTGAYIDFGATEDDVSLEAIEDFEALVGKHQAMVAFSSFWGEQTFPAAAVHIVEAHGSVPLVYWSPWDKPYREDLVLTKGPDQFSLAAVLAGKWDAYLDKWADGARNFGQPMFVSLCNEANGNWFPWSAQYYGAGKVVPGSNPPRYAGPETFKRAYRYIVDRVRDHGARNILWVLQLNNFSEPVEAWTAFAQYYPGPNYVDWLGLSVYGQQYPDGKWEGFASQMRQPYNELSALDPDKPIMVTEWGVGEFPTSGSKSAWLAEGLEAMSRDYPRLRAAVYWHERWQNDQNLFFSNLKVNSSPGALAAYRHGLESGSWIGWPQYR